MVEVFNLFFPTDRLYLPQSKKVDLYYIISRRIKIAVIIVPLAFPICILFTKLSFVDSLAVATILFISAVSSSVIAYCYSRVSIARLFWSEMFSVFVFLIAFILFLNKSTIIFGFSVYALEQSFKSIILGRALGVSTLRTIKLSLLINFKATEGFSNVYEGLTVTISNQIFRLPFAFLHGIDPIYFVAAQMPPAVYNVLIAVSNAQRYRPGTIIFLALMIMGGAMLIAVSALLPFPAQAPANLIVLAGFAILHGIQMIAIPGRSGIATDVVARSIVICGMAAVAIAGLNVHIGFFLAAPLVLFFGGEVFAFRRRRLVV